MAGPTLIPTFPLFLRCSCKLPLAEIVSRSLKYVGRKGTEYLGVHSSFVYKAGVNSGLNYPVNRHGRLRNFIDAATKTISVLCNGVSHPDTMERYIKSTAVAFC
jgi:hypothetical protein